MALNAADEARYAFNEAVMDISAESVDEATVRDAFKVFDKDGSGFLEKSEFVAILTRMSGSPLSDADADTIIAQLDVDGDGRISVEEFIAMVTVQV